ncbi:ATP-binding protein [bacterium]|nr:ATP-binding protein [bacterium]
METMVIIEKILPIAETAIRQSSELITRFHRRLLTGYLAITEAVYDRLVEKTEDRNYISFSRREYESLLENMLVWIDSIGDLLGDFTDEKLWGDWEKRFYEFLSEYPEHVTIIITDDFWLPKEGDTTYILLGKRYKRFLIWCGRAGVSMRNTIGKVLGKNPREPLIPRRSFNLHNFLRYRLEIPISHAITDEWQHRYNQIATQLARIHDSGESVKNSFLQVKDFQTLCADSDKDENSARLQQFHNHILLVKSMVEEIDVYEGGTGERQSDSLARIVREFGDKWGKAGTFALPDIDFDLKKFQQRRNMRGEEIAETGRAWKHHFDAEKDEWLKDIELSLFQVKAVITCSETNSLVEKSVTENILPRLKEIDLSTADSLEKFNLAVDSEKSVLGEKIVSESKTLIRQLREERIPALVDSINKAGIDAVFQDYIDQIRKLQDLIADTHILLLRRDLENMPPVSDTDEVPIKNLVREEIIVPLVGNHQVFSVRIHDRLERLINTVSGIDQIVEFNLSSALTLLNEGAAEETSENARGLVIEGLERTRLQLVDFEKSFIELSGDIRKDLMEMTLDLNNKIQELEDSTRIFDLKIRLARAKTRENVRHLSKTAWKRAESSVRQAIPYVMRYVRKIRTSYFRLRKMTGLTVPAISIDEKLARYLTESRQKISQLPYVYQRLFSLAPLLDSRFFAARDDEMALIRSDFALWRDGKSTSMAVVGEGGSGKTTLLNFAESDIFIGIPLVKINLTQTIYREADLLDTLKSAFNAPDVQTMEELESQLVKNNSQLICVMENVHQLFLRTVEGFDAIERFLLFVSVTQSTIFWVVTFSMYGWQYLEKVLNISKYFSRVLVLGVQTKEEMTAIIVKRHQLSGYKLVYEPPEAVQQSRKFRKLATEEERQAYLEDQLFRQLTEMSAGNIRTAILFWLMAIKEVTKDRFVLSPSIEFEHTFIYQLPSVELFTLAAVIQHEIINTHEHSVVFHQDIKDSLMILNRMFNRSLLQKNQDGYYFIHPFMYRPVVKALKSKNML